MNPSDVLRRAKEARITDLLDVDILRYYMVKAIGNIDKAIYLAEKEEAELDTVPWTHGGRGVAE